MVLPTFNMVLTTFYMVLPTFYMVLVSRVTRFFQTKKLKSRFTALREKFERFCFPDSKYAFQNLQKMENASFSPNSVHRFENILFGIVCLGTRFYFLLGLFFYKMFTRDWLGKTIIPKSVHPDIYNGYVNKMKKIKTRQIHKRRLQKNDCDKYQCLDT